MRQAALIGAAAFIALVGSTSGAAAAEKGSTSVCVQVIERDDWKRPAQAPKESSTKIPSESPLEEDGAAKANEKAPKKEGETPDGAVEAAAPGAEAGAEGDGELAGPLIGHDSLTGPPPSNPVDAEVPVRPKPWEPPPQEPEPASYYDSVVPLYVDSNLPIGQTSVVYLERLIEHFVTHEPGFVAAEEGGQCAETITVELYPLKRGWTVFARYSGTSREERVDQLFPSELSQFAERAVLALLHDVPLSSTINRENVLRADSQKSIQRVKGSNHFVLSLGTQLRGGYMDTVIEDGDGAGGTREEGAPVQPAQGGARIPGPVRELGARDHAPHRHRHGQDRGEEEPGRRSHRSGRGHGRGGALPAVLRSPRAHVFLSGGRRHLRAPVVPGGQARGAQRG